jgi:hypothetical protein
MPTLKNGRLYCDAKIDGKENTRSCNGLMRHRRKTNDWACTICSAVVPAEEIKEKLGTGTPD